MAIPQNEIHNKYNGYNISDKFSKKLDNADSGLLTRHMLQKFTKSIKQCFPTCVATVMADPHGFPIYSEIETGMDENLLALSAVEERRKFLDLHEYHKIVKPVGKDIRLLILLKKARQNYVHYGTFERIFKNQIKNVKE
ncbi:MAG: hypothetical protein DRO88_11470 [Promethearchaeia archaeon]|nr:MAG: hypothetical protein DRO88_11470 [Candidatus Lokiarchaeia archaeon]